MYYKLLPHQETVIEYAIKNPYSILSVACGGGKTLIAIDLQKRLNKKMLVICPSYLVSNWKSEILKFRGDEVVGTYIKSSKDLYDLWDTDICVVSYDIVQKSKLIEWADIVVLDEAQVIKTMEAKVTDFIHREVFENSKKRVHLLTGTPIKNRVKEFYSLIALCNYNPSLTLSPFLNKFEDCITFADYFSNRREYDIPIKNRFVKIVSWDGYKNLEELKSYLKDIYIRVEAEEFLTIDKPLKKLVTVDDRDDKELLKAFEYFETNNSVSSDVKAKAALLKVPATYKYVKELLEETDKVVVYTDHVEACRALADKLKVIPITGSTPNSDRKRLGDEFQYGESRIIVATIGSFSTGINLTASCNMVFNDVCWVPGDIEQAEYRIVRVGQNRPCVIHYIVASPQDIKILNTLDKKRSVIEVVV